MNKRLAATALVVSLSAPVLAEQAKQADSFVDSVGINTHMTYTDSAYASQWPTVLADLKNLHIRHIRDGFYNWAPGNLYYTEHQQLAAAGIDCDYVVGDTAMPTAAAVANVRANVSDMAFIEAPNEMDDQKGADWLSVLLADVPALHSAGSGAGVPVIGPSFTVQSSYYAIGNIGWTMNDNNLHVYFGGRNPGSTGWGNEDAEGNYYGSIGWWMDNANVDAPNVPAIIAESGYMVNPVPTPYTLPQDVASKYATRTILETFNAGVSKTYFYELADTDGSQGYGMMDANLNPKQSYTAVSNLLGLLQDPGASFTPGTLDYTLGGDTTNIHHLLLQKRDGTYYLVLWIEQSGYNEENNTYLNVPNQYITLNTSNGTIQQVNWMDINGGMHNWSNGPSSSYSIAIGDTPTIVQITNN